MRCLALAQAWRKNERQAGALHTRVIFISASLPVALERRIKDAHCEVVRIDAVPGSEADAKQTSEIVCRQMLSGVRPLISGLWLVVDGYHFGVAYQRIVCESGFRLLVIDDYAHQPIYQADILLNQNIHADRLNYSVNPNAIRLWGPRYALIRSEFLPWRNWKREMPSVARKVLVTLGGADNDNDTEKVMNALQSLDVDTRIVVGGLNPNFERLRSKVSCLSPHSSSYPLLQNVSDMPSLMAWADMAILAGGSTCWEACFMGLPMLNVVQAENQRGIVSGLAEEGAGVNLGEGRFINATIIAEQIAALLKDIDRRALLSASAQTLVDGNGTARLVACMQAGKLKLRPVTIADADLLLLWANDPETRSASFSSGVIDAAEHRIWLFRRLADASNRLFIAEDEDGMPVGHIRFELRESCASVSINVAPQARGRRLASLLIAAGTSAILRKDHPTRFEACIKCSNERSLRAFLVAGYRLAGSVKISGEKALRLILENNP